MSIEILFEDDALIAVNKPNNMLVYPSYYARNIKGPSLIDELRNILPSKLYPLHRLDYKTSGVIILGKSSEVAAHFQHQFEASSIEKKYLALVRGYTPDSGLIDSPVKNADTGIYKPAETHYKTLSQTEVDIPVIPYPKSRYSFVALFPKTGRMHQLRKHTNKISHPIIGDHKYGNRHHNSMFAENLGFENMFLHATEITFSHPVTDKRMQLSAAKPDFWVKAFERINLNLQGF